MLYGLNNRYSITILAINRDNIFFLYLFWVQTDSPKIIKVGPYREFKRKGIRKSIVYETG